MITQVMKKDTLFPTGDWILEFQKNADAKEFERRITLSSTGGGSSNSSINSNVSTSNNPLRVKYIDPSNFDSWYTTKKMKLDNKTILFGNLSEKITQNELSYIFDGFHLAEDPFRRISRNFFVNNNSYQAYFVRFQTAKEARRAVAEKTVPIEGIKPSVHWYNI
jgi:hypothetical protein